ncbi:class C sortase [Bifidobacterium oedipodis]|uniref:Sortase n=1 Tax=Bifidobacterium oedipodis TaxID=2675322 RepID=A0A7Y0ERK2_9BIFI|nr:sortase [Bifidobacterium sp. DSM 109957]
MRLLVVFFVVLLVAGIGLLAYPSVSDWWNRLHQSYAVASYIERADDMTARERERLLEEAHAYNERLLESAEGNQSARWNDLLRANGDEEALKRYESVLDITGTGIMGYVTVPKLKVRLPIYHGTDDAVLQIAVGHLPGSSLPVGGVGTHAVVSGHTGLPSARLLTGLDELAEGDTFAFHVLDGTYTYEVDHVSVVLPDELDDLDIVPGKDYATLVTCTPYGVNSHRLLVRGHRIPNPSVADDVSYPSPDNMILQVVAVAGALLVLAAVAAVILAARHKRHTKRQPKNTV